MDVLNNTLNDSSGDLMPQICDSCFLLNTIETETTQQVCNTG